MFDLSLGKSKPYALTIETGAGECSLDLGGLPITRLELKHGADKMDLDFSAPNPQRMSLLDLGSGAGSTEIKNLANANFAGMNVEGGAVGYILHFGGELQRDARVRIQTGLASIEISIPKSTAAKITPDFGGRQCGHWRWICRKGWRLHDTSRTRWQDPGSVHRGDYCIGVGANPNDIAPLSSEPRTQRNRRIPISLGFFISVCHVT